MRPITFRLIAACGLALLTYGCGGAGLRPDPNPYALASNVPTAELVACGSRVMGLKTCAIERGRPLSDVQIDVQGYNQGGVLATSEKCEVEFPVRYTGHAQVRVPLTGIARESCIVAVTITPEFPSERDSALVIGALKGFVWVRVTDPGEAWRGFETKIAAGVDTSIEVPAFDGQPNHIMVRGCGAKIDRDGMPEQGVMRVKLSEMPDPGVKGCVYEGAVISKGQALLFSWVVWRHTKDYVPAATPAVLIEGKRLSIAGDPSVSVLSLDGVYRLTSGRTFNFDPARAHVVRALTIGGRNVVGEYDPKGGFRWMR